MSNEEPTEEIGLQEAADRLGLHYMTVYRHVRLGKLPARKSGASWAIRLADLESLGRVESAPASGRRRPQWNRRLESRLIAGDEAASWSVVESALASGHSPEAVYLEMLAPAMRSIGARWQEGQIDVADEHRATRIAGRLIGRLSPRFSGPGRKKGTVVLGGAPGDSHSLGTALLTDLLRAANFIVDDLGANVPAPSFVHALQQADRLRGIGISVFRAGNEDSVRAAIRAVRAATDRPILLGGPGISGQTHAEQLGADGYAPSGREAVAAFLSLTE